ncbi:hypothetical protein MTR_4g073480 [Medicago truncatula]|uniref:Uncharacterized protein n=1 Tax=Medicago truncatula TaxID=3880 RepID=A0A072UN76_MEDTR|nr:hypothetical protein MTR_4g073480 [Medicago truncatula]
MDGSDISRLRKQKGTGEFHVTHTKGSETFKYKLRIVLYFGKTSSQKKKMNEENCRWNEGDSAV